MTYVSIEKNNLLNPAFCGEFLRRALYGFCDEKNESMPLILLYLVPPIVLTKAIREILPQGNERSKMHPWIENHPHAKIGFRSRLENYRDVTNQSILFLHKYKKIEISSKGLVSLVGYKRAPILRSDQIDHPDNIFKASTRVGKWFGQTSETSLVFAMWGITPQ